VSSSQNWQRTEVPVFFNLAFPVPHPDRLGQSRSCNRVLQYFSSLPFKELQPLRDKAAGDPQLPRRGRSSL